MKLKTPSDAISVPVDQTWTSEQSVDLYSIRKWGREFFDVSENGSVMVYPKGRGEGPGIDMMGIVSGLRARGMEMPVLLRFSDILATRITALNESFSKAIREAKYKNVYRGVFPIKVNQQQQVIEEVAEFGEKYGHGLEAGSKGELIAALAYMKDPEGLIVCNGYKDEEFVDLALYGQKMGLKTIMVLEMPGELSLILERARRMGIRPLLGVRAKLSTRAEGHWVNSGGDQSKFGLTAPQIIDAVDHLKALDQLDCMRMLHYHLGSQIPNIRSIRTALGEACRFYADLVREGAPMGILNVGGGLAVDYDGSHSNSISSSNYTIDEYAADVVEVVMESMEGSGIPHPMLVSESGRATVAHHSILLFNILDVTRVESHGFPEKLPEPMPVLLQNLFGVNETLEAGELQESYNDVTYYRDKLRSQFGSGGISLRERALGERMYWHIIRRIVEKIKTRDYVPEELRNLEASMADVYHCNFSVFQSLPDAWAINQLFPVIPIHRLHEKPVRQATLADITCDCDGTLDQFIDKRQSRHTLPIHDMKENEEYYLGVFLIGAYQETLGDLHNLLGDTNVVSIRLGDDHEIEFSREIEGDTVADVLSYMEYSPAEMVDRLRARAERAVKIGRIAPHERREIMAAYQDGLRGYTYFEQ